MLHLLVALTLLLTAADHWTTYLCLRAPVAGWQVIEANPIADWLFQNLGITTEDLRTDGDQLVLETTGTRLTLYSLPMVAAPCPIARP